LNAYQKTLKNLTTTEQERILRALHDQNEIALLLSCQLNCETISDLPQTIHKPVKELFECAFELLTKLDIRDHHYKAIYDATPHICPFCGCQPFDALGSRREALDHYLAESIYPLAGSNLRNLVPMCNKCNSGYKLGQDMLTKKNGTRRKSFDPYSYNCTGIKLSLEKSQPFAGTRTETGQLPRWQIEFKPNSEEVLTWDEVFDIRERYKRDVLDAEFNTWLRHFNSWLKCLNIPHSSDEELVEAMDRYANYYEDQGMSDRAFLKAAVFRMLHTHCKNDDQRLISFIRSVISVGTYTAN
jgi:hemerythrin